MFNCEWQEFQDERDQDGEVVDLILTYLPVKPCPIQAAFKSQSSPLDDNKLQAYVHHAKRILVLG